MYANIRIKLFYLLKIGWWQ